MKTKGNSARESNYIISTAFGILGLFMIIYSLANYSYMDQYSLGAGFYPVWIGIFLVLIAAFLVYETFRGRFDKKAGERDPERLQRGLVFTGISLCVLILINLLGMVVSLILLLFSSSVLIEKNGWLYSLVMAAVTTAVIYVVFHIIFYIKFPVGIFGF